MGNNVSHPSGITADTTAQQHKCAADMDLRHGLPRLPVTLATATAPRAASDAVSMPNSSGYDTTAATLKCSCLLSAADEPPIVKTHEHCINGKNSSTSHFVSLSEAAVKERGTAQHAHQGGDSSASSSSSSVVSVPSRGLTNDDTIPWHGSPHGSMPDLISATEDTADMPDTAAKDRRLQCTVTRAIGSAANVAGAGPVAAASSMQVGTLLITSKSTRAAEQMTWVVPKEQLCHMCSSNMAAGASPDKPAFVTSPSFVIPCAVDPAGAPGGVRDNKLDTIEWSLSLQSRSATSSSKDQSCSSSNSTSSLWQLYLHAAAVASTSTGAAAATTGAAAATAESASYAGGRTVAGSNPWNLHCSGRVEGTVGATKGISDFQATLTQDSQATLTHDSQAVALPLRISLENSSKSISTRDSSNSNLDCAQVDDSSSSFCRDHDHCQAAAATEKTTPAAHVSIPGSDNLRGDGLHIAVTFFDLHVKQADAFSLSTAVELQQQHEKATSQSAVAKLHLSETSDSSGHFTTAATGITSSSSALNIISGAGTTGSTDCADSTASTDAEQLAPGGDISSDKPAITPTAGAAAAAAPTAAASTGVTVKQLEAVLLSNAPRMLVIDDFFDAATCEGLMELARDKLVRSRVASGSETPSRTSWSHFFVKDAAKHQLIVSAEAQIEALFACPAVLGPLKPVAKAEALQVVKYHKGEFYHEHYDNRADSPLTRAATIIVYLCDTAAGGATSFPRAILGGWKESSTTAAAAGGGSVEGASGWQLPPKVAVGPLGVGIKVFPVRGRALVFWSKRVDGNEDPNSIHAADTVEMGEKWIATRWMKDT